MNTSRQPNSQDIPPADTQAALTALRQQNQQLAAQLSALQGEVNDLRRTQRQSITWDILFHPLIVLTVSLGAGLAFAALIILHRELQNGQYVFFLYYMVPISVPFVAFLFDRAKRLQDIGPYPLLLDLPLIALALARALTLLPLISGHALFLVYALLTSQDRVAKITAGLVFLEVMYWKIIVWRDATIVGGTILAVLAASVFYLVRRIPNPIEKRVKVT